MKNHPISKKQDQPERRRRQGGLTLNQKTFKDMAIQMVVKVVGGGRLETWKLEITQKLAERGWRRHWKKKIILDGKRLKLERKTNFGTLWQLV